MRAWDPNPTPKFEQKCRRQSCRGATVVATFLDLPNCRMLGAFENCCQIDGFPCYQLATLRMSEDIRRFPYP